MKRWIAAIVIFTTTLYFFIACAPKVQNYNYAVTHIVKWQSEPLVQKVCNEYFEAQLFPVEGKYGFESFFITVINKTNEDIELIWDKTLFIDQGTTNGSFMFKGVVYKDRNNVKPPDIIFANSTFSKEMWPNNLVHFSADPHGDPYLLNPYRSWRHQKMQEGENGVYLTIKASGKELHEKMLLTITRHKVEVSK